MQSGTGMEARHRSCMTIWMNWTTFRRNRAAGGAAGMRSIAHRLTRRATAIPGVSPGLTRRNAAAPGIMRHPLRRTRDTGQQPRHQTVGRHPYRAVTQHQHRTTAILHSTAHQILRSTATHRHPRRRATHLQEHRTAGIPLHIISTFPQHRRELILRQPPAGAQNMYMAALSLHAVIIRNPSLHSVRSPGQLRLPARAAGEAS